MKTERKVYVGLGFLFLILFAIGVYANRSVATLVDHSDFLVQTAEVKDSLEDLSSLLTEFQSNRDNSVGNSIRATVASIRVKTIDSPRQQGRLDALDPLIATLLNESSPALMNEIKRNIALLRQEQDRLLTQRHAETKGMAEQTATIVRAGAAIGLLVVFAFALTIRRGVRRRREVREELERFFDLSLDLFCIRSFDGKFKRLNSAWERTLGYKRDELFANPFTAFIHPDDIQPTLTKVNELIGGKNTINFDNRYRTKSGGFRWLRWTATAFHEERLIYSAARDITHLKEEEVSRARHTESVALVSHTTDVLQSCETPMDACKVIDRMAPQLFAGLSGAVYQLAPSRNVLERLASWGTTAPPENFIAPADCLSLKRGRGAITQPDSPLHCHHIQDSTRPYICIPMMALNDTIGMLHLRQQSAEFGIEDRHLTFATSIAEQFALTLANLRLRETLRAQSIRDPLTGLFNRRYLEESLEREIHRASRNATPLSVLMLDLDHFKHFNDSFGHDAGDAVLRQWGGFLQVRVRFEDIVCRLGGEEFAIVLPDATMESAYDVAQRICEDARSLAVNHRDNQLGPITVSIGVASFPGHSGSAETLLEVADHALYQAKSAGRNRVVIAALDSE
jgi:diguanylate cyclase (GGDEF)-like protein/PAS domain S-box-containing protein